MRQKVEELAKLVVASAQVEARDTDVANSIAEQVIWHRATGMIEGTVGASHWKAWIQEYGKGSLMDRSNPNLNEYIESIYWNEARYPTPGAPIVGRPEGSYIGLDDQIHYSRGHMQGKNLEYRVPGIEPSPPLHFMRNALLSNKNLIEDQLQAALDNFDWGRFLVVTRE
jgi:hypothetical protein